MLEFLGPAAVGALATLAVTWWLNRNNATREARTETYRELLTMLKAALRVQQSAILDHESPIPDVISNDRVDEFNARLEMDVSPQVRELASKAFRLIARFNMSHSVQVPIELDEHGFYRYRYDLARGVDPETAHLAMRMSLRGIHDELTPIVDQIGARVRREVHGTQARRIRRA
jgi:hypothetical protein